MQNVVQNLLDDNESKFISLIKIVCDIFFSCIQLQSKNVSFDTLDIVFAPQNWLCAVCCLTVPFLSCHIGHTREAGDARNNCRVALALSVLILIEFRHFSFSKHVSSLRMSPFTVHRAKFSFIVFLVRIFVFRHHLLVRVCVLTGFCFRMHSILLWILC